MPISIDAWSIQGLCELPAAAVGSFGLFAPAATELDGDFWSKGLRLRLLSEVRAGGERERLSNLEERFGSGSVWSNLDLFLL